ncbi:MAG: neutral ceramidase [Verrucomicrobiales bacterium]|jgi:neutral ceramidase
MNSISTITVLALAVAGFLLPAAFAQESQFNAGAAVVDISPDVFPFQLRSGPSRYVHDPISVRALAFENGADNRCLIAIIDAIGIGREMADKAKMAFAEKTGWDPESIMIAATHAHTTPKGGDTSPGRIAYEKKRRAGLAEALLKAIEALEPAKVGFASDEEASEVRNRRNFYEEGSSSTRNPLGGYDKVRMNGGTKGIIKPAGPIDPEVCVVDVRTERGKPLGLLANYALHYVGGIPSVTEEDGRVRGMASADYFGEFARVMPFRMGGRAPEGFVAMMSNGASGDINNIPFGIERAPRAPFEQCRIVASKAADASWRAIKKIETYDTAPVIATRQREVTLNYRRPTDAEVKIALSLLELNPKERGEIHKKTTNYANHTIRFAEPESLRTENVIVQAFRIGDQAIVSMPFEVLVEIGLELKEKSPAPRTFMIELANGSYGYLPPPNQVELGGYETWLGTSRFEKHSSEVLVKELLEMLGELWE